MQRATEMAFERAPRGPFTREQASLWLGSQGASLDALLKRAVGAGEVWRIHRGLYCLSDRFARGMLEPLELAQRICGPSYVSLESALSRHGWIPEGVQAITSVTHGRSRSFDTPVGLFTFTRVPQRRLLAGVRRVQVEGSAAYYLATPLKALADLVYVQKRDWRSIEPVVESLRIEPEALAGLAPPDFDEVASAYRPGRVSRFLAALRKELQP